MWRHFHSVYRAMIFKSCLVMGEELHEGGERWVYLALSSPIRAVNGEGMYEDFSYVILAEKETEKGFVVVVIGCYDSEYQEMNTVPIINNLLNGGDIEMIMKGLGYEWQEELH